MRTMKLIRNEIATFCKILSSELGLVLTQSKNVNSYQKFREHFHGSDHLENKKSKVSYKSKVLFFSPDRGGQSARMETLRQCSSPVVKLN